jgi:hypothetical protein
MREYYIRHEEDDRLCWNSEEKVWVDCTVDGNWIPTYNHKRNKLPPHGVWEALHEIDEHLGCANWPNCDTEGCGYH